MLSIFMEFSYIFTQNTPIPVVQACRKSGIMALDVDVVECHGSGRFIADAIEANDDSMGI